MPTYTLEQLRNEGPQFAMVMLLQCIKNGEPFVTYGDIRSELEYQLKIKTIFSTRIGHVAGTLMNQILEIEPKAPLINVLVTRPHGIPGSGVGDYLAERYKNNSLRDWDNVPLNDKKRIIQKEREKIFKYKHWEDLNKKLFDTSTGLILRDKENTDSEFSNHSCGGVSESEEHKKLKEYVLKNPHDIGISKSFTSGELESRLLSGDVIDVLFSNGVSFKTVEVKSCRSNDQDLKRGIYQCVKYREVKKAEHLPYEISVQAILVTERKLPEELKERARLLGVKHRVLSVNT